MPEIARSRLEFPSREENDGVGAYAVACANAVLHGIYISREISIEHPRVGLALLAQQYLFNDHRRKLDFISKGITTPIYDESSKP